MIFEGARSFFPTIQTPSQGNLGVCTELPHHVAFTMDGNRRWASLRAMPALEGHRQGAEALCRVIDAAVKQSISWLTFYAFSTENWNRSSEEIEAIMGLARNFSGRYLDELHDKGARLRVLGERQGLDAKLIARIDEAEHFTRNNRVVHINLAFNYSGRYDIAHAARQIAHKVLQGELNADEISAANFGEYLTTAEMPPPDLLIRTGGEHRLSNFLLWESAYAELLFLDVLWPDFSAEELRGAVAEFQRRASRADAFPNRAAGA